MKDWKRNFRGTISRRAFLAGSAGMVVGSTALAALRGGNQAILGDAESPAGARPLTVCMVSGSLEYKSDESLAAFQDCFEKHYSARCTRAFRKTDQDLPGLENLETCDCMLLFTRRLTPSPEQIQRIQAYCRKGRPVVALRTASHAFQNWLAFDKEVLGGDYQGHYGNKIPTRLEVADTGKGHPLLEGFGPFVSDGSLYKNPKIAADTTVLLTGTIPDHSEPVAWVRLNRGGRVFYTSLGHSNDFRQPGFIRLLVNALYWAADRTPVKHP